MGIYDGNPAVNNYVMVFKGGNIGIGATNASYKLDVNGVIRAYDGTNANSGFVALHGGGVSGTDRCGHISFYQPTNGNRAGYIGWGNTINSLKYIFMWAENGYSGYNIAQDLVVSGSTTIYKQLLMNVPTSETRAVTESRIFSSLPIITGAFGGDNYLSGYWGVAIGLNAGG
jgi:hypothetical protein